jgi:very-short-patch-repair endonuclease
MLRRWSGRPAITVPSRRRRSGLIEIHCSVLPADERTVLDGIPITTWPRTLLDLATALDHDALIRALNEADARELTDPLSLTALLERHRGERGAGALRRALDDASRGRGITRKELEERFAAFVRRSGLPAPLLNAPIQADGRHHFADALWPEARLIVELQSVRFHGTAAAMSADADRTRRLTLAGYRVVYVTWAQLAGQPARDSLDRDLRTMLSLARA